MGRIYLRKTERGADGSRYTSEALCRAIADVKSLKKTVKGASTAYNIPKTTLRHHLNGTRGKGRVAKTGCGGGRNTDISFEDEQRLADCLGVLEKWGFGLTRTEVFDIVQTYAKQNNLKTRFKDHRPGEEWYIAFAKRHKLSLKKPQGVEYARMAQINPFVIYSYLDLLADTVKILKLEDRPHLILNLDESSFSHDPSKAKVGGAKGAKGTGMISSPGRENTSILICCSAAGNKVPPLVIFKGKNVLENWLNVNETDKTFYAATQRGWMETTIFSKWFKDCFLPNVHEERPLLFLYDGHSSHVSIQLIEDALANEVTILKLPPHTTHVLQPLDVAVFKSLKNYWEKDLLTWQRKNPRQRIPKATFVALLNRVYDKLSPEVIKNGFKATGIFPLSKDVIKADIFKSADLKLYNKQKKNESSKNKELENQTHTAGAFSSTSVNATSMNDSNPSLVVEGLNCDTVLNFDLTSEPHFDVEQPPNPVQLNEPTEEPNSEKLNANAEELVPAADEEPIPGIKELNSQINQQNKQNPSKEVNKDFKNLNPDTEGANSFESILLGFIRGNKDNSTQSSPQAVKSRKKICTNAEIITTAQYLAKRKEGEEAKQKALEAKEEKKKAALKRREEKQQNKKPIKKKKTVPSSSESESDIPNEEVEDELDSDEDVNESTVEVLADDYVIVSYESEYYPGQVIELDPKNTDLVTVKHMEKSGKLDGWKWPKKYDILKYEMREIYKIIPPPVFKVPAQSNFQKNVPY